MFLTRKQIQFSEIGLIFKNGKFVKAIEEGNYWIFDMFNTVRIEVENQRTACIESIELEQLAMSNQLDDKAMFVDLKDNERALIRVDGRFEGLMGPGLFGFWTKFRKVEVQVEDQRIAWIASTELDQLAQNEQLEGEAQFVDLKDNERAVIWIDGRFDNIVGPGLYGFWKRFHNVEVEILDANELRVYRKDLEVILKSANSKIFFNVTDISEGKVGVLFVNGEFSDILPAGKQVFWKGMAVIKIVLIEKREQVMDISGQELMTQDKVTLRMNGQLTYRITDARKSVETVENVEKALYREAQLVLRKEVGSRTLEALLSEKEDLVQGAKATLVQVAKNFGVEVLGLGVRDVILPGDMKERMNKVIEAQKASEANVIKRREETAAMRSQMNTAKLIENNPTLMRLRELEVLETVAKTSNLQVVLGEQGLTDRLTKLI
jgi:regulator of protease activity HflC (stomatin/prohibitin superfamily)